MASKSFVSGLVLLYIIEFQLLLAALSFNNALSNIDTSKVVIQFDPYVSILDKADRSRYDIYDLQIFITKVATRFSRIYVELTDADLLPPDKSIFLAPLAISKYNCFASTTKKLDLWIGFDYKIKSSHQNIHILERLKYIVNATNNECASTVSTILVLEPTLQIKELYGPLISPEPDKFLANVRKLSEILNLNFGVLENFPIICPSYILSEFRPNVMLIKGVKSFNVQRPPNFEYFLNECNAKLKKLNLNTTIGFIQGIPDTSDNVTNTSEFLSSWETLTRRANQSGYEVVISSAFDTPYKANADEKVMGWWRLVENFSYNCTSDYIFDEKSAVAKDVDWQENPTNFNWLEDKISFSTNTTGIIFRSHERLDIKAASLEDFKKLVGGTTRVFVMSNDPLKSLPQFLFQPQLTFIFNKSHILVNSTNYEVLHKAIDNILKNSQHLYSFINLVYKKVQSFKSNDANSSLENFIRTYVSNIYNNSDFLDKFNEYWQKSFQLESFNTRLNSTLQNEEKTEVLKQIIIHKLIRHVGYNLYPSFVNFSNPSIVNLVYIIPYEQNDISRVQNGNIGYSFNISLCGIYSQRSTNIPEDLLIILSDNSYKIFVFHFNEDQETIKLGATRMAQQRIVLFEQCRQLVLGYGNVKTEITFVLLEYNMDLDFYESPWKLQNNVKYWKILNEWVVSQTNVVLFFQAVDRPKSNIDATPTLGWWRFDESQATKENFRGSLVDKQEDALKISKIQFLPKSNNFTITQITVIVVFVGILGVIFLFFIKRQFPKSELSKKEINGFFTDNDSVDILNRFPYNKERYEIGQSRFSIDQDFVLGSGEFGKVVRGKVKTIQQTYIYVAVKTINPNKNQVIGLKGLLSEITLLAYIGKHPNITELIGANTKHINSGKVLAFLEFCHLGSLQNYLREIRRVMSAPIVEYYGENAESSEYSNKACTGNNLLDPELSNNFLRWSQEICSAMAFLSEKSIVHADLATRNVLLDKSFVAKVSDFGLSRRMYNYKIYKKLGQEPLPWKWMAPESLRMNVFSEKSDVWSFGITIWEIYTLGEVPYQGLDWDVNFSYMIDRGLRPSKPSFDEKDMYSLILKCWNMNSDLRPSFTNLFTQLTAKR